MYSGLKRQVHGRSVALLSTLETRLHAILFMWLLIAGLACCVRLATSPAPIGHVFVFAAAPYVLLVLAPIASALLALRWFADGHLQPQPATRLAIAGRWRTVTRCDAERHRLYGASGIMVSLLVGLLLNAPVRALEFLAAMPPAPFGAPQWLATLHLAMTFDAVLFISLYTVAFVAALRRVPLFPRLLVAIWLADIMMQVAIASVVGAAPGLPADVAAALQALLDGNIKKVLVSISLWLPYLLLSTRVNVTYRHRLPA